MSDVLENIRRSRAAAQTIILPRLLPLVGVHGKLVPIEEPERHVDPRVRVLDTLGGVDFWIERPGLVLIASRVQWLD